MGIIDSKPESNNNKSSFPDYILDEINKILMISDSKKPKVSTIISKIFESFSYQNGKEEQLLTDLIDYMKLFDVSFQTSKSFQSSLGEIIIHKQQIQKGSYGAIKSGYYKAVPLAVKIPKNITFNESQFTESLIHALLSCDEHREYYLDSIQSQYTVTPVEYPISHIYFIAKSNTGLLLTGMELLQITFSQFITLRTTTTENFKDVILQIVVKLSLMQKKFGFMHRDFHGDNIMLKKRERSITFQYEMSGGFLITTTSEYEVFFIDFGMSCVDFSVCSECNFHLTLSPGSPYGLLTSKEITCKNFSFDLRYLFGFLKENLYNKILPFLNKQGCMIRLINTSILNIDLSKYTTSLRNILDRHKKIATAVNIENPLFLPDNVMYSILTEGF
jgi:hypothetical protein